MKMEEEGFGRRHAHMHTISFAQPQKMTLTSILLFLLKAEVQAGLHIRSTQFVRSTFFCQTAHSKNCCSPPFFQEKNYYYHKRPTIKKIILLTHMPTTLKNKNKNCVFL
jgi:hypothetical protein